MSFVYTEKQLKGFDILADPRYRYILFDGGSRSGKTVLLAIWYIFRALKYPNTRRLIARLSKKTCKSSVWKQTLLPILYSDKFKGCFNEQKTDNIIEFKNGSEIWMGGFENALNEDEVLGQEWADIWINEATDLKFERFGKLKTRLNIDPSYKKKTGFEGKFVFDCNPRGTGHFLNKMFNKNIAPDTGLSLEALDKSELGRLFWHPIDNKMNLDDKYFSNLERLTGLNRKRFWDGVWSDQIENAVYRFDRSINLSNRHKIDQSLETWCSLDFGVSDPTSIIWYQIEQVPPSVNDKGILIHIFDEYETNNKPVSHYADIIKRKCYRDTSYCGDPSGKNRNESLESWISKFREYGINIKTRYAHSRSELIDNANEWLKCIRINEQQCPKTVEMFENWELESDKNDKPKEGIPLHDEYSHLGTSFWYFIINRFPIKKPSKVMIV